MKKLEIYTDGGCRGNGKAINKGAWAFAIVEDDTVLYSDSYGERDTTNNKMELQALISGLNYCALYYSGAEITAIVDSTYVMNGITDWIHTWMLKGWKTADKKPVKNKELWLALLELQDQLRITYKWTKGHAENRFNNFVDDLCNKEMDKL